MCCQATISSKTKYNKQSFNFLENKTKKLKKKITKHLILQKKHQQKKIFYQQDIRLYVYVYYILYEHGSIYIKKS